MMGRKDKKQFERKEISGESWKNKRDEHVNKLNDWKNTDYDKYLEAFVGGKYSKSSKEELLNKLSKHLTQESKLDERPKRYLAYAIRGRLKQGIITKEELADALNKYVPKNDVLKRKIFAEILEMAQVTEPLKAKGIKTPWGAERENLLEQIGKSRKIRLLKKLEERGIIPTSNKRDIELDKIKLKDSVMGIFKKQMLGVSLEYGGYNEILEDVVYALQQGAITTKDLRELNEKYTAGSKGWKDLIDKADRMARYRSSLQLKEKKA